jgi:peptidoglycan/xylan/chitin deacetylase (PgdA/CDA1 family)
MYLHYTPRLLHWLYPHLLWHMPRAEKVLYLTFDDGPIPEVTPAVLSILSEWNAKATFFCVGDNVRKHPQVAAQVVGEGHRLGNHTYHHLKGTQTEPQRYLQDVALCHRVLEPYLSGGGTKLFRPPYGRFTRQQLSQLKQEYRLVMWDVLPADFDPALPAEACLRKSIRYTRAGSIVVFHDSLKAWDRLQWVLPRYLQHFHQQGYRFSAL